MPLHTVSKCDKIIFSGRCATEHTVMLVKDSSFRRCTWFRKWAAPKRAIWFFVTHVGKNIWNGAILSNEFMTRFDDEHLRYCTSFKPSRWGDYFGINFKEMYHSLRTEFTKTRFFAKLGASRKTLCGHSKVALWQPISIDFQRLRPLLSE